MNAIVLDAVGLTKRFGGVIALNNLSLRQSAGETLGMIGPNGSGKTTFVNVITGHLKANAGSVTFGGRDLTNKRPHEVVASGLTRTYQAVRVFGALSVRENVETALKNAPAPLSRKEADEIAHWLRIAHTFEAAAGSLTLYEQRRLELLMRLTQSPRLIMLDEPVGGLSSAEMRSMIEVLSQLKARCSIFLIEHSMRVIRELADRVVVLVAGETLAEGRPEDVLQDRRVIDHYLGGPNA